MFIYSAATVFSIPWDLWSEGVLIALQYGLRWIESSSQRWGPGSRWNHLLDSYVTPINRSNAFLRFLKNPNFEQTGKSQFWKGHSPIILMFGFLKKNIHYIIWLMWHRKPKGGPILSPALISGSWTQPFLRCKFALHCVGEVPSCNSGKTDTSTI